MTVNFNMLFYFSDEEYLKSMATFFDFVYASPIKFQAVGFIDIDLALLPKCVTFIVSYTITILQINNII